jgi:hypothetical protein
LRALLALALVLGVAACQSPQDLGCTTPAPDPDRVAPEAVKARLLALVEGEWRRFGSASVTLNGIDPEPLTLGLPRSENDRDPLIFDALSAYWTAVGRTDIVARERAKLMRGQSPDWAEAWSAAFISWAMARGGAPRKDFCPDQAHWRYLRSIVLAPPAKAPPRFIVHDPAQYPPRPGDLICTTRAGVTVIDWKDALLRADPLPLHCDLVVGLGAFELRAIGGNVSDSVVETRTPIDGSGFLYPVPGRAWFAVVENRFPDTAPGS